MPFRFRSILPQLGGARDLIEATIRGTQHMAFDGPGVVSQFFPKVSVLDMPFLFDSYDQFLKVHNSSYGEELRQELLEKTEPSYSGCLLLRIPSADDKQEACSHHGRS